MEGTVPDVKGSLVDLDAIPFARLLTLDEGSPVAIAVRRVLEAARNDSGDVLAEFGNSI